MKPKTFSLPIIIFLLIGSFKQLIAQLPEDFYDQVFASGFDFPTGITFDDNGRAFVWEKKGIVHILDSLGQRSDTPLIDISEEVMNWKDHGLMGFALDPSFLKNGYFYLLYAVDLHHYFNFGTANYHPDTTLINGPSFGRVVRFTADPNTNFSKVLPDSRKILLGESINNGISLLYEFHGLGTLLVGQDGTLIISCGDGTSNHGADTGGDSLFSFASEAIRYGIITPDENIGSYKSQYLGSYNGKILRISAQTGDGLASNPFFDPENPRSPQSRTWALGFRNPYRIAIQPETGSHYPADGQPGIIFAGDVGNGAWEELNIVDQGGMNFGWPIYEGNLLMWSFFIKEVPQNRLAGNPLFGSGCEQEYFNFRDLLKPPRKDEDLVFQNPCNSFEPIPESVFPMEARFPIISWSNAMWNKPTRAMVPVFNESGDISNLAVEDPFSGVDAEPFDGFSSLAGVFYNAEAFPEKYHNKFFSMDFSGWIKVFDLDEEQQLLSVQSFHDEAKDIIHLALNPMDGSLYYINISGEIRKISFGGNPAPVAIIEADKLFGPGPLTVQFDASKSFDANSNHLNFEWDFGDGQIQTAPQTSFTFSSQGNNIKSFPVTLKATDEEGAFSSQTVIVSVNNSPPQVDISSFEDGDQYPVDKTILLILEADVSDAEHNNEDLLYQWKVFLHHNDHFHPEPTDFNPITHMLVSPLGCEEEIYYYRIELTVSDPEGLSTTKSQIIYPYCQEDFVSWNNLKAETISEAIHLEWNSELEEEVLHYEVQRSSNFFDFKKIGNLQPKGPNTSYEFIDHSPLVGSNIYRIKAIQKERAFDYSNLATASYPKVPDIRIYPNPASKQFQIEIKEVQSNKVEFELFGSNGGKILNRKWETINGESFKKTIISSDLPRGLYLYRIQNGQEQIIGRLILGY